MKKLVGETVTILQKDEIQGVLQRQTEYEDLVRVAVRLLLPYYEPASGDSVEYMGEETKKETA